ncbi:MAG: DUF3376 domain-containing protein [Mycobacterium sp.]
MGWSMRQVRYAVVFNGGVSLAVWMGGVTHELNRIRLASEQVTDPALDLSSSAAWQAILRRCGRSAVIDVLAGTSAGGLNGTLLATAVARGTDLPDMGAKWVEVASLDVGALTRNDTAGATSVLSGEYFREKIGQILALMKTPIVPPRESTLLVTATALNSPPKPVKLEVSQPMYARDGRRVFQFERRDAPPSGVVEPIDDFSGAGVETLADAARASASYPVAFSPVLEGADLIVKRVNAPDDGRQSWLVDGGVLDNAPFEPLIDVLRERPTNEPFDRVLLYVTPGVAKDDWTQPRLETPGLAATIGGVISAMREPDERLDADVLGELFRQMGYSRSQAHRNIVDYLAAPVDAPTEGLFDAADAMILAYRVTRAETTERWLKSVSGCGDANVLRPPSEPEIDPDDVPGMPPPAFPSYGRSSWQWGWSAADRILRWWGRALSEMQKPPYSCPVEPAMEVVGLAQREVSARWKLLESAVTGSPQNPQKPEDQLEAMRAIYDAESDGLAMVLADQMRSAADAIEACIPGVDAIGLIEVSLGVEVVSGSFSWAGGPYDTPRVSYHNITPAVGLPPGLAAADRGAEASKIDDPDWPSRKLYGERLDHFGAFASADGRRHDWLWGRLDGASELSNQLLTAAGVKGPESFLLRRALISEILMAESTSVAKVVADAEKVSTLDDTALLKDLAEGDGGAAVRKLEDTVWVLSRQFGDIGGWVRLVLAREWSPDPRPPTARNLATVAGQRAVRMLTGFIRRKVRAKLPFG